MTLTFTFTANASHELTIQWFHDGVLVEDGNYDGVVVSGATTRTMVIANATSVWDGSYYAIVTDATADCSVQTDSVEVVVPNLCRLEITVQPINQNITEGGGFTLTVGYTGATEPPTFQWYKDDVALVDGGVVSGATTDTLMISSADLTYNGSYTVVITDIGLEECSVTSEAATVTVSSPTCELEITAQPASGDYDEGEDVELTVIATGAVGSPTYQWYLDGDPLADGPAGDATISGATTATLSITDITVALAGDYSVIVTDPGVADCSATSANATVTVNPSECTLAIDDQISGSVCNLVIEDQPLTQSVEVGDTLNLSFTFSSNGGPFTIQWFKDGVPLTDGVSGGVTTSGATTTNLTLTNVQLTSAGDYTATISNDAYETVCAAETDEAVITVDEPPPSTEATAYWRLNEINEPIVDGEGPATTRADAVASTDLSVATGTIPGYEDAIAGVAASAQCPSATCRLDTSSQTSLAYTTGNSVSFSFWVKFLEPLATAGGNLFELDILGTGTDNEIFTYTTDGTDVIVAIENSVEYDEIVVVTAPVVDQWYFWTIVIDGATGLMSFYIDNVLQGTTSIPVFLDTAAAGRIQIWNDSFSPAVRFSQMGLWLNHLLTPTQITYLYNSGAGRDWPFTLP